MRPHLDKIPQAFTVTAVKTGYNPETQSVPLKANKLVLVDFVLVPE